MHTCQWRYNPDDIVIQQTSATNKNKEHIALKLSRLKDKVTRYDSDKDF